MTGILEGSCLLVVFVENYSFFPHSFYTIIGYDQAKAGIFVHRTMDR